MSKHKYNFSRVGMKALYRDMQDLYERGLHSEVVDLARAEHDIVGVDADELYHMPGTEAARQAISTLRQKMHWLGYFR